MVDVARPARTYDWVKRYRAAIWGLVVVVVLVFGFAVPPWDAIGQVIQDKGVGDDTGVLVAFAAGYCAPAVAATAIAVHCWARKIFDGIGGVAATGLVFIGASVLASLLTFGLPADFTGVRWTGPPWIALVSIAFQAYLNSYGFALFFMAVVIGVAVGLESLHHAERISG